MAKLKKELNCGNPVEASCNLILLQSFPLRLCTCAVVALQNIRARFFCHLELQLKLRGREKVRQFAEQSKRQLNFRREINWRKIR